MYLLFHHLIVHHPLKNCLLAGHVFRHIRCHIWGSWRHWANPIDWADSIRPVRITKAWVLIPIVSSMMPFHAHLEQTWKAGSSVPITGTVCRSAPRLCADIGTRDRYYVPTLINMMVRCWLCESSVHSNPQRSLMHKSPNYEIYTSSGGWIMSRFISFSSLELIPPHFMKPPEARATCLAKLSRLS